MYLSLLMIDVGDNPDHPRPGRRWLGNLYHVHQRLSMAFPSREQREKDAEFLKPFDPAGFERARFLFRVDDAVKENCPRAVILVQSEAMPDWGYAFQNAPKFLAAPPEFKKFNPAFAEGQRLRFRIRVNLSKRSGEGKSKGKRVALTWDEKKSPDEAVREWFAAKGNACGFSLDPANERFKLVQLGWVSGYRPKEEKQMKFRAALIEGILTVTDAERFKGTIETGIGHGKAFGFGLLSVAPIKE
ncbi:type I-E CRISPR-associated protein Cas6/Cse3/CasE [Candidatus Sumerlaeota bacterium]|nr:type I-E CRISPR-associated protein Cas6/Cse3/CasE [Candidatus Sumerlaeota bacterium]